MIQWKRFCAWGTDHEHAGKVLNGMDSDRSTPTGMISSDITDRIEMNIAGSKRMIAAGEHIHIPMNVPHFVKALEDTLLLETFTLLRDDLLEE